MIPNSRQLLTTDTRPVPNTHRFSFSHQSDYQRIDDEAAAMAQQQRKFSSRFLPDAKRKSRPKSLPVANNPIPRSNTNPLTRSFNALIQRFRRKPSTSKKSTAIPLPNPALHGVCNTTLHCHHHDGSSSSSISSSASGSISPSQSIFNGSSNNDDELPTTVKRNSMMSRCSNMTTGHSIYSTFPCNDIEEEEHDSEQWSPRTSLISSSTAQMQQQQHPSADDLHMQPECISHRQEMSDTTTNQNHPRMTADSNSLHNDKQHKETDSAIDIDSIREVAERLWDDDDTSICSLEERAEWLGTCDRFRAQVLKHYMSRFDFTCQRLDVAFRTLCGKLYFKAEAQQMDRILGAFAYRYWECHANNMVHDIGPQKTFGSPDGVYAVAYAILLLNTDLHVAHQGKGGRHKMTQSKFVRNTMATLRGLGFPLPTTTTSISCFSLPVHFVSPSSSIQETSLRASESTVSTLTSSNMSCSTSSHISLWPLERSHSLTGSSSSVRHHPQESPSSSSPSRRRRWTYTLDPRSSASSSNKKQKHGNNNNRRRRKISVTPTQKAWMTEMEALLKDIYMSIKAHPIAQMSPAAAAMSSSTTTAPHETNINSSGGVKNSSLRKEGLLTRKHVMESRDKKARQRGWQLCRVVVQEGSMYLYSTSPSSLSCSSSFALNDNGQQRRRQRERPRTLSTITHSYYYRSFRSNSTQINLRHSLTTAMPYASGCGHQRPFVFCVKAADGAVWLFETLTSEAAHEWTQVCNYWAARLSKEPLDGAICNLDYGWATDNTAAMIHDWTPPPPPSTLSSRLSPSDQLVMLQRRITLLEQELDQHRTFKDRIYQRFAGSYYNASHRKKALDNWECKAQYLIQEVIKMHTYHDTLLLHHSSSSSTT